jgi:hypothetical protein
MTTLEQTTATITADPYGMTNKKSQWQNQKQRRRQGWERFHIPTHRDEAAMNGAPDLFVAG